jgi:protein-disulfide isomerase-like protein with CxxC motif
LLKVAAWETIVSEARTTQTTTLVAVAGVLGTLLGATISPLVNYLTNERQVDVKMIEIGLGILREPPKEDAQTMRAWAIEVIEKSSGRPFSEQQRNILLKKELSVKRDAATDDQLTAMLLMLSQSIQEQAGKPRARIQLVPPNDGHPIPPPPPPPPKP